MLELADCLEHGYVILNLILLSCYDLNSSHNLYNEAGCMHECFMWEMVQELQEKELCLPPKFILYDVGHMREDKMTHPITRQEFRVEGDWGKHK